MRLDLFNVISASKSVILGLDFSPHGEALADARASLPEAFEQKRRNQRDFGDGDRGGDGRARKFRDH
jgi:hypothetical protein